MKKITALLGFTSLILLFSCKKDNIIPETNTPNSASFKASTLITDATTVIDDTKTLQTQLNAGNVTLTAGRVYNVTGLTVTHSLNMNGAVINMTATTGAAIKLTAAGANVTNGSIKGTWDNSTPGNPCGAIGMRILADNCSISHVTVSAFPAYGILVGANNNPSVTYCTISNTGYIAFFYDAETASTTGGTFSNNIVDRSMLPASTVSQLAIGIRGSTSNANITTSKWTVSGNNIKMPYLPADWAAECIEVRYFNNSTISSNTVSGGSIGISVVRSSGVIVSGTQASGSQLEGIEFADSRSCTAQSNVISSSTGVGELIDGGTGSSNITIMGDIISGTVKECIHTYTNTTYLTVTGCTLTAGAGAKAINLQGTSQVNIQNTTFNGTGVGSMAVMMDTCPGNLAMSGCSVSNFRSCVLSVYSAKAGMVTDNINLTGITITSVPVCLSTVMQNGALLGSNVVITL